MNSRTTTLTKFPSLHTFKVHNAMISSDGCVCIVPDLLLHLLMPPLSSNICLQIRLCLHNHVALEAVMKQAVEQLNSSTVPAPTALV